MTFIERKQRLEYLLEMIEKGRCLSLQQVSENFSCSKRTVKRMLADLREDDNKIGYCKVSQKFFIEK